MNPNRTYGIEIETHSRLPRTEIRSRIEQAFRDAGIDHHCVTDQYGHDTDQTNFTYWKVKPDSSITRQANAAITSTHPVGAEIVSPILKGEAGLEALKTVCVILDTDDFRISKTCGLHVHHGVNRNQEKESRFVNSWINTEQLVMKVLPPSRQRNFYCRTWRDKIADSSFDFDGDVPKCREGRDAYDWWRENVDDRYANVNLGSLRVRNTFEFRLHSGTVEFIKIKNWLIWTQAYVDCSLKQEFSATSFSNLMEKIEKLSGSQVIEPINDAPQLFNPDAKKQKLPKQGTKLRLIADMLLEGKRKDQIVRALNDKFGHNTKSHRTQVTCKIADFQTLKYGFGWKISKDNAGRYKVVTDSGLSPRPVHISDGECSDDIKKACQWMTDRYELFSS